MNVYDGGCTCDDAREEPLSSLWKETIFLLPLFLVTQLASEGRVDLRCEIHKWLLNEHVLINILQGE